jgi:transposase InsO family protein
MGQWISRKRVAHLMRLNGIQARRKQDYKSTTKRDTSREPAPNLLAQDFSAEAMNQTWVADIPYIDIMKDGST